VGAESQLYAEGREQEETSVSRQECEEKLLGLMEQAAAIYRECIPDAGALSLYSSAKGHIDIFGYKDDLVILHITRFSDGDTWYTDKWEEVQ